MERPARTVNAMPHPLRLRLAASLALALALGGCSVFDAPRISRGHRLSEEQLTQLVPGVQGRADVQTLLGTPSARGTFDDNFWYYISATSRYRPMQKEYVSDREVVVVEFDDAGKLKQVRKLGEDDARPVAMVQRETPVPGNDRSTLQALFGNVGRFNPLSGAAASMNQSNPGANQPTGRPVSY